MVETRTSAVLFLADLRSDAFGPCSYGSLEGLLFCQPSLAEPMVVKIKGDGNTCTDRLLMSSWSTQVAVT